jgi:fatty acid desaturase
MVEAVLPETPSRKAGRLALAVDDADLVRLGALSEPNERVFLMALGGHLGVWALGLAAVAWAQGHFLAQAIIGVLMGSQLHALTVLQHDCGHQSAFRSRDANLWVGRALAWFIFMPFTAFTELHRLHHSHLGVEGRDPDSWFYAAGPRWAHWRECLFLPRFIWLSLVWPLSPKARGRVKGELAFNTLGHGVLAAALAWAGRVDVALFAFLLPMLALACIFNPLARGAEHAPLAHLSPDDPRRHDIRFNTVTVANRWWGVAWANITYHVEHHLYPRVPFHRLPELHRMLKNRRYLRTTTLFPFVRPPKSETRSTETERSWRHAQDI